MHPKKVIYSDNQGINLNAVIIAVKGINMAKILKSWLRFCNITAIFLRTSCP